MRNHFKIAIACIAMTTFTSCYYDKKDQVYPQVAIPTCDTTNITYSTTITSIFLNSINYVSSIAVSKRMPPSAKLVDCKIIQIQKWIQKGYPQ